MPRVAPKIRANARRLRREATPEERAIWRLVHDHWPRLTRQLPVGPYVLDLACRSCKLAIELDGSQHLERVEEDAARTRFLESLGWSVLRFWNADVRDNPAGVAEAIVATVADCGGRTHPRPLPAREGRDG